MHKLQHVCFWLVFIGHEPSAAARAWTRAQGFCSTTNCTALYLSFVLCIVNHMCLRMQLDSTNFSSDVRPKLSRQRCVDPVLHILLAQTPCAARLAEHCQAVQFVPANDETALKRAVAAQPVSVGICVTLELAFYSSGIYDAPSCLEMNHGVLVVGYGTEEDKDGKKQPFWRLKNSWGSGWGDRCICTLMPLMHW